MRTTKLKDSVPVKLVVHVNLFMCKMFAVYSYGTVLLNLHGERGREILS